MTERDIYQRALAHAINLRESMPAEVQEKRASEREHKRYLEDVARIVSYLCDLQEQAYMDEPERECE